MKLSRDVDVSDFLIFFGLSLVGVGLFYWFGLGVSLTVSGGLLLVIGIAANIAEGRKSKP